MTLDVSFEISDSDAYRVKLLHLVDQIAEISVMFKEKASHGHFSEERDDRWSDPEFVKAMLKETGQKYLVGSGALWLYLHSIGHQPRFTPNDFDIITSSYMRVDLKFRSTSNFHSDMTGRDFVFVHASSPKISKASRGIKSIKKLLAIPMEELKKEQGGYENSSDEDEDSRDEHEDYSDEDGDYRDENEDYSDENSAVKERKFKASSVKVELIEKEDGDPLDFVKNFDIEVAKVIYDIEERNFDMTDESVLEHIRMGVSKYYTQDFNLFVGRDLQTHLTTTTLVRVKKYMERGFVFPDFDDIDELLVKSSMVQGFKKDNFYTVDADGPIRDIEEYIERNLSTLGFDNEVKKFGKSCEYYARTARNINKFTVSSMHNINAIFLYGTKKPKELKFGNNSVHVSASFDECIAPEEMENYRKYPMARVYDRRYASGRNHFEGDIAVEKEWAYLTSSPLKIGFFQHKFYYKNTEPLLFGAYNIEGRLFKKSIEPYREMSLEEEFAQTKPSLTIIPQRVKEICLDNLKRLKYFLSQEKPIFPAILGTKIVLKPPVKTNYKFDHDICRAIFKNLLEVLNPLLESCSAIIAGSFVLYMMGDNSFVPSDMDIYVKADVLWIEMFERLTGHECAYMGMPVAGSFITGIHNFKFFSSSFMIQVIEIKTDYYRMLDSFDLEFCKAVYTPHAGFNLTEPSVIEAIAERRSEYKPNWWNIDLNGNFNAETRKRIKKYIKRGFTITYQGITLTEKIIDEMPETAKESMAYPVDLVYEHPKEVFNILSNTHEMTFEELEERFS